MEGIKVEEGSPSGTEGGGSSSRTTNTSSPCLFFSVPKPCLDSFEHFYIPDLVSIGPHHSGRRELECMASHKSEARRRMQSRIHSTLEAIVEKEIIEREKRIRVSYNKEMLETPQQLARMLTDDACFIYEFMLSYFKIVHVIDVEEPIPTAQYDSIFDACCMSPTWDRILFNLLLFGNQIPFSILELLVENGMDVEKATNVTRRMKNRGNRLRIFHNDWLETLVSRRSYCVFDWCRFPNREDIAPENNHLLNIFYTASVGLTGRFNSNHTGEPYPKLPTARLLKQKGINFKATKELHRWPIESVAFQEKSSTLCLPQVYVDAFRIALIRNFVALEVTNNIYNPFPMTSFVMFMNELINDGEDCRVLSESGIIVNMLGSDEDVAKSFNSITQGMRVRGSTCECIDNAREGLHDYLKKWHRILWSEFCSTYFSKPWRTAGLMAAVSLLLLTATQVFCLFYTCNP